MAKTPSDPSEPSGRRERRNRGSALDFWDRLICRNVAAPAVPFHGVLARELQVIRAKRKGERIPPRPDDMGASVKAPDVVADALRENLTGLAFSGGGIRSATFSLGVLQGLADLKVLSRFDYLSTVSGGGYIGSWLTALTDRENRKPRPAQGGSGTEKLHGIFKVEHRLRTVRQKNESPEDPAVTWLRQYSNYLTPRVGFLTADTWTTVAVYLRNLFLNLLVLVGGLAVLPLVPRLVRAVNEAVNVPSELAGRYLSLGLGIVATCGMGYSFASLNKRTNGDAKGGEDRRRIRLLQQTSVQALIVLPIVASAFLASHWLLPLVGDRPWIWAAFSGVAYGLSWHTAAAIGNQSRWGAIGVQGWWWSSLAAVSILFSLVWKVDLTRIAVAAVLVTLGWLLLGVLSLRRGWDKALARWCWLVALAFVSGAIGGLVLWWLAGRIAHWKSWPEDVWLVYVWGTPVITLWFVLLGVFHTGLMGRLLLDRQREWLNRLGAWLLIYALGWTAVFALVVYGPVAVLALQGGWKTALASGWMLSTLAGLLAGRGGGNGVGRLRRLLMAVTPYVFVLGLLVLLAFGMDWGLGRFGEADSWTPFLREVRTIHGDAESERRAAAAAEEAGRYPAPPGKSWLARLDEAHRKYLAETTDGRPVLLPFLALGLLAAAGFLAWRIDVNEFSMHRYYRNRLVRAYLGASVNVEERTRLRQPFTGFYQGDDIALAGVEARDPESACDTRGLLVTEKGPLPIVNTALNLVAGEDLAWQERKAASFVMTPLYCGYHVWDDGTPKNPESRILAHGYRPTADPAKGGPAFGSDPQPLTLGSAFAISGAAASPNMGFRSSPSFAFLLTVFNVRLGWWLGNPRHKWTWTRSVPFTALLQLFRELTGKTQGRTRYVYLSDGGHFENLGLYELVRRRCRYVVVCDAGADPELEFDDLANAIRKCRADFGVDIEIDVGPLRHDSETGLSTWHCAVGTIHYSKNPDGAEQGLLLYVKASLTGDEPEDVLSYRRGDETFPHQSTADQFFDESQFESYRRLGHHIATEVLGRAVDRAQVDDGNGGERFQPETMWLALGEQWWSASRAKVGAFMRHATALDALYERQRASDALAFLDGQFYPEWPRLLHGSEMPEDLPPDTLWLPEPPGERRAGFYFCNSLTQLMENVYLDLDLEDEHDHPDNRGWMNLFKHWTWSGMFRVTWSISAATYGHRFQSFCRERLGLDLGQIEVASCLELDAEPGPAAVDAFDEGLEARGLTFLNFFEREHVRLFLRYASVAVRRVVQPELALYGVGGKPLLRFAFAYALIDDRGHVVLYRVQDHLRRMGLGRRGLARLMESGLAEARPLRANLGKLLRQVARAKGEADEERAAESLAARRRFELEFSGGVRRLRTLVDSVRRELEETRRINGGGGETP